MAINVFGYDKDVYPLHIGAASKHIPRMNLLLIEKGRVQHYTWIMTSIDSSTARASMRDGSTSARDVSTVSPERTC
jgi:hypothetical protein